MVYSVTFTSQGQISIPAPIRRKYNLGKGKKALVVDREGEIVIEPIIDFFELAGSLKTNKKPLTNKQLHDIVAQASADEYAEKLKRIKKQKGK